MGSSKEPSGLGSFKRNFKTPGGREIPRELRSGLGSSSGLGLGQQGLFACSPAWTVTGKGMGKHRSGRRHLLAQRPRHMRAALAQIKGFVVSAGEEASWAPWLWTKLPSSDSLFLLIKLFVCVCDSCGQCACRWGSGYRLIGLSKFPQVSKWEA